MKTIQIPKYECEVCKTQYNSKTSALMCERKPVTHDDVNVGDVVEITGGDGIGMKLRVEEKTILDMEWGHYRADRYHHTVAVSGKIIDSWGSLFLTFDQRKPIKTK